MCHEQWALTVIKRLRFFVLIIILWASHLTRRKRCRTYNSSLVLKRAMSTFLHVHVPIFNHTSIEYEKSASLEKCKKVEMARFSTRELL